MTVIKEADIFINSSDRKKNYKNVLSSDIYYLKKDPILIEENSNILKIEIKNHNLVKDDLIIIENVVSDTIEDDFDIELNINEIKINISKYLDEFKNYDEYIMKISIDETKSNLLFNTLNVNSIQLNQIIRINNDKLIISLENNYYSNIDKENIRIKFTFQDFNNLKLKNINSNYPINENRTEGYKIVNEVEKDFIYIEIKDISNKNNIFGGENIMINKINYQEKGYENSNFYEINLFKVFYNIISIEIVSSYFPNLIKFIDEKYNTNKFQWIDENKNNYEIELENNYNVIQNIEKKINNTKIINSTNFYHVKSEITENVFFTFNIYSKIVLYQSLSKLNSNSNIIQSEFSLEKIKIFIANHNLKSGDEIILENVLSFEGIPSDVLNTNHSITVLDENNIFITLQSYNIDNNSINDKNNGGNNILLFIKKKIKLIQNNLTNKLGIFNYSYSDQIKNTIPVKIENSFFYIKTIINNGDECINNFTKNGLSNILKKQYIQMNNEYETKKTRLFFDPPLPSLYKMLFYYEFNDGSLVDFYNMESNFILRVSYLDS